MKATRALLIFAKAPRPGSVKTRLHSAVSPRIAARIHAACLADTLRLALRINDCDVMIFTAGGMTHFGRMLQAQTRPRKRGGNLRTLPQKGSDLGARLENAHKRAFRRGYQKVLVIGTDSPWMGEKTLRAAFDALRKAEIVIGPAEDGGYFLLGMRKNQAELFREIPWSTQRVCELTLRAAKNAGLRVKKLRCDFDLDRPEDLRRAQKMLRRDPRRAPALAQVLRALG